MGTTGTTMASFSFFQLLFR